MTPSNLLEAAIIHLEILISYTNNNIEFNED